jgi:Abortive infection C-terminus
LKELMPTTAKLYKAAAAAMNIAPDQHSERIIKQILSGVGTVATGLATMHNST